MRLFSFCLGFFAASAAFAELGFYPPEHVKVPAAVGQARRSVLRIVPLVDKALVELPTRGSKQDQAQVAAILDARKNDFIGQLAIKEYLQALQNGDKTFPIYYNQNSTAFLARDATTIWTSAHTFAKAMGIPITGEATKEFLIRNILPRAVKILLIDEGGNIVFDTRRATDTARFESIVVMSQSLWIKDDTSLDPTQRILNMLKNGSNFALFDYCSITLNRALDLPVLQFANAPKLGDPVFVVGYPKATQSRAALGFPDADGATLRVSIGKVLDPIAAHMGITQKYNKEQIASVLPAALDRMLVSDVDSVEGQSGAPILTADGLVWAINHGIATHPKTENSNQLETYAHPDGGNYLNVSPTRANILPAWEALYKN